jgi:hypothetical protein
MTRLYQTAGHQPPARTRQRLAGQSVSVRPRRESNPLRAALEAAALPSGPWGWSDRAATALRRAIAQHSPNPPRPRWTRTGDVQPVPLHRPAAGGPVVGCQTITPFVSNQYWALVPLHGYCWTIVPLPVELPRASRH